MHADPKASLRELATGMKVQQVWSLHFVCPSERGGIYRTRQTTRPLLLFLFSVLLLRVAASKYTYSILKSKTNDQLIRSFYFCLGGVTDCDYGLPKLPTVT